MGTWSFWGLVGWFSLVRNIFKCSLNHRKVECHFPWSEGHCAHLAVTCLPLTKWHLTFVFVFQTFALKWSARFELMLVGFGFFICLGFFVVMVKLSFDLLCRLFLHSCCSHSVHIALGWNEDVSLDNNNQGHFYSWLQVTSFTSAF